MSIYKLGVIGGGFMSTAIVKGILSSKVLSNEDIIVSDIFEESLSRAKALNVSVTTDNTFLANNSEYVLFAVKPQNLDSVIDEIGSINLTKIITIMAGIKKRRIRNTFKNSRVARCMPNTPCSIGSGAMGLDVSEFDGEEKQFIFDIFSSLGKVVLVPEEKLNAVTGISGSAPAYFYLFADSLIKAGIKSGLTEEESKALVVNTMIGSGKMLLNCVDKKTEDLVNAVCSKGGTTIEAVKVYKESGLYEITDNAVKACVKRAGELDK